jgi:hypothetical protein
MPYPVTFILQLFATLYSVSHTLQR